MQSKLIKDTPTFSIGKFGYDKVMPGIFENDAFQKFLST